MHVMWILIPYTASYQLPDKLKRAYYCYTYELLQKSKVIASPWPCGLVPQAFLFLLIVYRAVGDGEAGEAMASPLFGNLA